MLSHVRRAAMTPLWVAQLATGTKSFERNCVIGSRRLNEWGLHAARVALAHRLASARRRKLAGLISMQDREAFERDGFVVRPNFLPSGQFAALIALLSARYCGHATGGGSSAMPAAAMPSQWSGCRASCAMPVPDHPTHSR